MFSTPTLIVIVFGGSVLLHGVTAWICNVRGLRRPLLTAFLVTAVITTLIAIRLGWQGDAWTLSSAIVKMTILFGACAIPSAVAAFVTHVIRVGPFIGRLAVGTICGALIAAFMPIVAIAANCMALGDCL